MDRKTRGRIILGVVAPLVIVALLALMAVTPRPSTHISVEVTTEAMSLRLAEPWSISEAVHLDNSLYVSGISEFGIEPLGSVSNAPTETEALTDLHVDGNNVQISRLSIPSGALVEIEPREGGSLSVFIRNGLVDAQLYLAGEARVSFGSTVEAETQPFGGVAIDFTAESDGAVPVRLDFRPNEPWAIRGLSIDSIAFVQERPGEPTRVSLQSAVLGGTVVVEDAGGRTQRLREGAVLSLAEFTGVATKVTVDTSVDVILEGAARGVWTGSAGFRRSLKPSTLEYWYHIPSWRILAASLIAVLTIGLSVVEVFFE